MVSGCTEQGQLWLMAGSGFLWRKKAERQRFCPEPFPDLLASCPSTPTLTWQSLQVGGSNQEVVGFGLILAVLPHTEPADRTTVVENPEQPTLGTGTAGVPPRCTPIQLCPVVLWLQHRAPWDTSAEQSGLNPTYQMSMAMTRTAARTKKAKIPRETRMVVFSRGSLRSGTENCDSLWHSERTLQPGFGACSHPTAPSSTH